MVDRNEFAITAGEFFKQLFEHALENGCGEIEIRTFPKGHYPTQDFFASIEDAVDKAYELLSQGVDVYFGVNPRIGKGGEKRNVHYLTSFHAEIDYGTEGHKKESTHKNYDQALQAIRSFTIPPTVIVHSGGGFHLYWLLQEPLKVASTGTAFIEDINKRLSSELGGDTGHDISRVLRVPGSFNFKLEGNPREVNVVSNEGHRYTLSDFTSLQTKTATKESEEKVDITSLPVSKKIQSLILNGNDGTYPSRSEADMAAITVLINQGISESAIKSIWQDTNFKIGEKYREHNDPDKYLMHTVIAAKGRSDLTDAEMANPLFVTSAITKKNSKCKISTIKFQEYIVTKHKMKIFDGSFFRYNGCCYEQCDYDDLNYLCQRELGDYRGLFSKTALTEFIHFATGDVLVDRDRVKQAQIDYLTLQNGLYNPKEKKLIPHTPDIFTTNLLPYDYDPDATCPRFIQYLDEVFIEDVEKILFVQEAIGYCFHKEIPVPAMFLLVGVGGNGKSIFINTTTDLFGEDNTCSISLNLLGKEHYVFELFNKILNISSETPRAEKINTDMIKAVVAGDWITGRVVYKQPVKFKPFAKHFLAMNDKPTIDDDSHGMWRRIYVIEFPRIFQDDEEDKSLTQKLRSELSGIFNWALEGYERLTRNNFMFTKAQSMEQSKKNYRDSSNSSALFIKECLIKSDIANEIKFSKLYDDYTRYCFDKGYKKYDSKSRLKDELVKMGYDAYHSSKDSNQLYVRGSKLDDKCEIDSLDDPLPSPKVDQY